MCMNHVDESLHAGDKNFSKIGSKGWKIYNVNTDYSIHLYFPESLLKISLKGLMLIRIIIYIKVCRKLKMNIL